MVRTGGDEDGQPRAHRLAARSARRAHYTSRTLFVPPFDSATSTAFEDAGTLPRPTRGGYRARHTVFVSANLDAGGVWSGTFRVRTRVTQGASSWTRCRLKSVEMVGARRRERAKLIVGVHAAVGLMIVAPAEAAKWRGKTPGAAGGGPYGRRRLVSQVRIRYLRALHATARC